MSDSAFKSAPYPSYSTAQLREWVANGHERATIMTAEIERRAKRDAGDVSVMTDGERLRHVQTKES